LSTSISPRVVHICEEWPDEFSTAGDKPCELLWIAVENVGTEPSRRNVDIGGRDRFDVW